MVDKKKRDKWADLMVEQYNLEEQIKAETNPQQKSLLEMDLNKISKKINKLEKDLFDTKPEIKNDCKTCKHGLLSITFEPCKTCIEGESRYEKL